jgi:hypothetical protein
MDLFSFFRSLWKKHQSEIIEFVSMPLVFESNPYTSASHDYQWAGHDPSNRV